MSEQSRIEWRRAGQALGRLIADSERTEEVFELIEALSGASGDRIYEDFANDPRGQALLATKPSLLQALSDRQRLKALPEGSLGRTYADFMDVGDLSADGLVEASERPGQIPDEQSADEDWYGCRLRDSHDLWHVLTGYGRDEAGEVALLAFTYGRLRNRGIGVIVAAGALIGLLHGGLAWPGYLRRAKQRGAAARALQFAPFEEWLSRPLVDVRADCGISPPALAHPDGIAVGSRGEEFDVAAV